MMMAARAALLCASVNAFAPSHTQNLRARPLRAGDDDFDISAYKLDPDGGDSGDLDLGPLDMSGGDDEFDLEKYMAENSLGDLGGGLGFDPYGDAGASAGGATEGAGKGYVWQQTADSLSVAVPVPEGTRAKDVVVEYPTRESVVVRLKGEDEPRCAGALGGAVVVDDTFWSLEDARDDGNLALVLDVAKAGGSRELWDGFLAAEGNAYDAAITETCFFDVSVGGENAGRVEMGLFGDDVPETAANFAALCRGVEIDGTTYSYAGEHNAFHRVIPGFMAQGGDVTAGDGTGGTSIFGGAPFADEAFPFRHKGGDGGLLSMANSGPDSNKSQFFITFADCTWLDGKHVVFGRVTAGMDVVRKLEAAGSPGGDTAEDCRITACGVL